MGGSRKCESRAQPPKHLKNIAGSYGTRIRRLLRMLLEGQVPQGALLMLLGKSHCWWAPTGEDSTVVFGIPPLSTLLNSLLPNRYYSIAYRINIVLGTIDFNLQQGREKKTT